jgi:hypothetical protein
MVKPNPVSALETGFFHVPKNPVSKAETGLSDFCVTRHYTSCAIDRVPPAAVY